MLGALVAHPGVGFVLVRCAQRGPVVLGRAGAHHLRDGCVEDADPLSPFGPLAARQVLRTDGFATWPT